jgi:aryl-alcohol dehydrogenase-like predicted oxidoreductase
MKESEGQDLKKSPPGSSRTRRTFVSTVITGASRVEQVHENMKAAQFADKLTPEIMEKIDTIFEVKQEVEED